LLSEFDEMEAERGAVSNKKLLIKHLKTIET
jgi:hypothetical protein